MRIVAGILLSLISLAVEAESQSPGARFSVDPQTLPAPYATKSVSNGPDVVKRPADSGLAVPQGFTATLFADKLPNARTIAVAPNGDIFVARSQDGIISILRDGGDGKASFVGTYAEDFELPFGLAFRPGALYVADSRGVFVIPYNDGDVKAIAKPRQITPDNVFGEAGGHWTRNLVFAPDGKHFYAAVGSSENVTTEDAPPRATIEEFDSDGSHGRTFASGLRNPVGIAFYPGTNDLYTVVNERDDLGNGLVPDYFTRVVPGGFYGWPYAYLGHNKQPALGDMHPDLVAQSILPDVLFDSHSAPLGLTFYTGAAFPASYKGGAFVALHGSWNRADPTGYKVVFIPFADGRPKNEYYNFATGFRLDDADPAPHQAKVWGRPVGVAVDSHGNLLISDDAGGTVWQVKYK